jgi:hypothetical protein
MIHPSRIEPSRESYDRYIIAYDQQRKDAQVKLEMLRDQLAARLEQQGKLGTL